ncbi:hypothetical protein [Pseudoxanthomonas mexicana]|uniref:hypothetical protein n=1 Tax=Pseudoxanthomonas mexicana TaxID=128785 RepID=UPI0028B12E59|nr:hypothetical protein [Pseudoxanthomonas mexicana]
MISASTNYGPLTLKSSMSIKDACVIVDQQIDDPLSDMVGRVSRWMIDTRYAQVRAGLIALGWTPPAEGA